MEKNRPNILFVLNDQRTYYRHGWDGGPMPQRSHFDGLARESISYDPVQIREYGSFRDELAGKPPVYLKEDDEPLGRDGRQIRPNAQITQVDAAGGLILGELDRLGFAENNLVIWSTHHGNPIAANGGHFGKEAFLSEEVRRIPMARRWSRRAAPGPVSQHLVSNLDLPVTLLDAAGTGFGGPVEGRSLLDIAVGERRTEAEPWRQAVASETYGHHHEPVKAQALATDRYKYAAYRYHETPGVLWQLIFQSTLTKCTTWSRTPTRCTIWLMVRITKEQLPVSESTSRIGAIQKAQLPWTGKLLARLLCPGGFCGIIPSI